VNERVMGQDGPVDDSAIQALRDLDRPGEQSFLAEMIQIFFEDSPPRLAALRTALARGDAEEVTDVAHALKGSCANFGAQTLERLCRGLESCGRSGRLDGADALLEEVFAEYARVRAALSRYL